MESSPLSKIPGELRNRIWRAILITPGRSIDVAGKTSPNEPGLLAVCVQIRAEAMEIYYAENTFRVKAIAGSLPTLFWKSENLVSWLRCIGDERASMIDKLLIAAKGNGVSMYEQDFVEEVTQALRRSSRCKADSTAIAHRTIEALLASGLQLQAVGMASPGLDVPDAFEWVFFKEMFDEVLSEIKEGEEV